MPHCSSSYLMQCIDALQLYSLLISPFHDHHDIFTHIGFTWHDLCMTFTTSIRPPYMTLSVSLFIVNGVWHLVTPITRDRPSLPLDQEGSTIGDLDGMPSRHPPKIVGVVSKCQESRSILTKFANHRTLYQALCNKLIWSLYRYLVVIRYWDSANVIFFGGNRLGTAEIARELKIIDLFKILCRIDTWSTRQTFW
jgi:hypothetical protein